MKYVVHSNSNSHAKLGGRPIRLRVEGLTEARYDRVRSQYDALVDIENRFADKTGELSKYIVRDIWTALNNPNVPLDKDTDAKPLRRVVDWVMGQMNQVPGFTAIAADSKNNVICSTLATRAVVNTLAGLKWPPPPTDTPVYTVQLPGEGPEGPEQEIDRVQVRVNKDGGKGIVRITRTTSFADGSGESKVHESIGFDTVEEAEKFAKEYIDKLGGEVTQDAEAGMAEWEAEIERMLDAIKGSDKTRARETAEAEIEDARDEVEDMVLGVTTAWGREHAERAFKDPSKADLALVRKIASNRSLAEFLRSVGRFMKSMRRSRVRERVPGHTIPIGVTKARELRHLLPIESALLGVGGAVRAHQVARVMSQQAQGRRMYDYAAKGSGPVHVALDISGSMSSFQSKQGVYYGNAFAAAAVLYAVENRRKVTCSVFDTHVTPLEVDASSPEARLAFIEAMLNQHPRGGTSFIPLFEHVEGLGYCEDVLLISDGCGDIDEAATRRIMRQRNLNYLVVGEYDSCVEPLLKELAGPDRTILANSLLDGSASALAAKAVNRH